jgi:hypothetical protein
MRRCLIICALSISACSKPDPRPVQPYIPADLLTPCLTPALQSQTEGQLARKALRIAADRDCANAKIGAIAQIVASPPKGR